MKTIRTRPVLPLPFLALAFVLATSAVHAASFVVWPGQSLQAAIDAAAAGDNITVQTGTYNENLTITKGIDIRGTGGAVLVTGTLTITNPALPVYIADITFGKSGASGFTVTGSSNVRFDRIKLVGGGNLGATNSTIYCYKGQFDNSVSFTGSTWTLQRSTIAGTLTSGTSTAKCIATTVTGNFSHNNGELTVFQSNLVEFCDVVLTASQKSWICYNTLRYLQINGGTSEVVGNWMDGRDRNDYFVLLHGGAVTTIRNNRLWNDGRRYQSSFPPGAYDGAIAIRVLGNAGMTRIFNNTMRDIFGGIEVQGSPTGVEIRGNIHRDVSLPAWSVSTGHAGTIVSHNNFQYAINGGVQSSNINADAQFDSNDVLGATSPSRNAGPSDALFNDLDGSRNDQGAYGGHSYDPTGRTTLKPVVLSGDVSPLYVKRGGAVTITARAAVAAAP
jgi:nitrous oxidase accessory protein NosD